MSFISYAQNFEDVMLWRALKSVDKGTYIDIGAQDPIIDSVSLAFHERGWWGLHVEPTARYANALRSARPGDEVWQVAVGRQAGTIRFYEFDDTGLSTGDQAIAEHHRQRGYEGRETEVKVVTLDDLLAPFENVPIHWMKIDVEGMEGDVIAGWQHAAARPWILVIESSRPSLQEHSHQHWEPELLRKGYRFVYFDGVNRFYLSDAHPELADAFAAPPNVFDEFALGGKATHAFCQQLHHQIHLAEVRAAEAEANAYQVNLRIHSLTESLQRIEQQLHDSEEALRQQQLEHEQLIHQLMTSRSWRLTAPLRATADHLRHLRSLYRDGAVWRTFNEMSNRAVQWSARRVAGNPRLKQLAMAILKRTPWLFEHLTRRLNRLDTQPGRGRQGTLPASHASLTARARRLHRKLKPSSLPGSRS